MMSRKKRPIVDWLRWARKPFLYLFFSLGAGFFYALEKLEELLGGKTLRTRPSSAGRNLNVTFVAEEDDATLVLPFIQLFSSDNKWIKLPYERILRELRRDRRLLKLPGRAYGKGISEGPYEVNAVALLASQGEVALFLRRLNEAGFPFRVGSVLATPRTGGLPHAKGLLLRMAVGSRRIELAIAKGADRIVGEKPEQALRYLENGVEYHHLFVAVASEDTEKILELIDSRGAEGLVLSLYAALNSSFGTLIPIFLLESSEEQKRLEDAALLLIQWPVEVRPPGA